MAVINKTTTVGVLPAMKYQENGTVLEVVTVAIAAADLDDAADDVLLVRFPSFEDGIYLTSFAATPTDMDTNASPTLDINFIVCGIDAVADFTLIDANLTAGVGGTKETADANVLPVNVSGLYIGFNIDVAAATAAAGSIKLEMGLAYGVVPKSY
jgi:hypothetical protein